MDAWLKDDAPSTDLRTWPRPGELGRVPPSLRSRARCEPAGWQPLVAAADSGVITLRYSDRDRDHNKAVAMRDHLRSRPRRPG